MAVRNFWIEATIDGRRTQLKGGPQGRDGGFHLVIYQRENGLITSPLTIEGSIGPHGDLVLQAVDSSGSEVFYNQTRR